MPYELIVILIVNILRTALLKRMLEHFLSAKDWGQRITKTVYILYYLIISIAYSSLQVSVLYEMCNLAGIVGVTVLYQDAWKKKLWISFAFLCMDMGCTLSVYLTFLNVGGMQQTSVHVLLLLICVTLITHTSSPAGSKEIVFDKKQMLLLISIPLLSVLAFMGMLYGNMGGFMAAFLCTVIVTLNLCVFSLYHVLLQNYVQLREQDIYKQQTFAYQNQLKVIMESQSCVRALKHDMKNHMLTLQALAKGTQSEKLSEYIASMQEFMINPSEHVYTGNEAIDSLLNYKLQMAESSLKRVETDIVIPRQVKLYSFDLNVVLGNLLDNAIAAAEQTEEQLLSFRMRMEKGILFLDIVNSCTDIPDGVCDIGKLSEKSAYGHGIGLANVKRIVEKYHGEMEMCCEANRMQTEVMLYMKEM